MKINHYNRVNLNPYKKQIEKNEAAESIKRQDKVEISQEAKKLQESNGMEGRQEKIQELKNQINNGHYEIDATTVAKKILSFWKKDN
ncbi:flagellar biosynthesis anti-sigma factor FlgM [Niallia sp. 01092]|uniref:flagellar biosynthesis anti-sigma factor FlgM n=1 Tax=unclassified Niallia TaxID=2837522 RepID=UPI003FCF9533